ncbi:MAG TPA: DUF6186 family protein [Streptosporangiaceae bacterium]|nr:DUF6186 family protein [Streptosporangiaceae bacterium]
MTTRIITMTGFAGLLAVLAALEVLGRRPGNRIPTAGQWLGYLMRRPAGRLLVLLGWLWLGWHYFAR